MKVFCQASLIFHGGHNVVDIIEFLMTYAQSHKLLRIYNHNNNSSNFQCKILGEWAEGPPLPRTCMEFAFWIKPIFQVLKPMMGHF